MIAKSVIMIITVVHYYGVSITESYTSLDKCEKVKAHLHDKKRDMIRDVFYKVDCVKL